MLCLLLALNIFNCSIDSPDLKPDYIPENLNINDRESIVEFVLEDCLEYANMVPEQDEDDEADDGNLSLLKIDFFIQNCFYPAAEISWIILDKEINPVWTSRFRMQHLPEITGPPPKSIFLC